jgi:hypothetical protein
MIKNPMPETIPESTKKQVSIGCQTITIPVNPGTQRNGAANDGHFGFGAHPNLSTS